MTWEFYVYLFGWDERTRMSDVCPRPSPKVSDMTGYISCANTYELSLDMVENLILEMEVSQSNPKPYTSWTGSDNGPW